MNEREAIDVALAAGFGGDREEMTASEYKSLWFVEFKAEVSGSFGAAVFLIDPATGQTARMPSWSPDELVELFHVRQRSDD